jgi:phosphoribosylaminoimidazole-succinocarboxamide synthase
MPEADLETLRQHIASTSDERTRNNVMRHEYRVLNDTEKQQMQALKDKALELYQLIDGMGSSRELSLARTKTEEAVMWAVKHITR